MIRTTDIISQHINRVGFYLALVPPSNKLIKNNTIVHSAEKRKLLYEHCLMW